MVGSSVGVGGVVGVVVGMTIVGVGRARVGVGAAIVEVGARVDDRVATAVVPGSDDGVGDATATTV